MENSGIKRLKRILAIICLVLIAGMYLVTFVTAIIKTELAQTLFKASIAASITLPAFVWLIMTFVKLKKSKDKKEEQ